MTDYEDVVRRAAVDISRCTLPLCEVCKKECEFANVSNKESVDNIKMKILSHLPEPTSPWVSVERGKPLENSLSVALTGYGVFVASYHGDEWIAKGVNGVCYGLHDVTHWMPLPPVPEDDSDRA